MGENSHLCLYLLQYPIPTYKLHASSPKTSSVGTMTTLWQRCTILGNTSQTMEVCSDVLSTYGPHHWILNTHTYMAHGWWGTSKGGSQTMGCAMWDMAKLTVTAFLTVKPRHFHGYKCDCKWCAHDSGMVCLQCGICWTNLNQLRRKAFLFGSKQQRVASHWLNLSFYEAVSYIIWRFIRNSWECHVTVTIWPSWN